MAPSRTRPTFAQLLVAFDENPVDPPDATAPSELVIPEDLGTLDDEALLALHEEAVAAFDAVYGDGSNLTQADLDALASLTEGIETISAEVAAREAAVAERATAAAELAARVHEPPAVAEPGDEEDGEQTPESDAATEPVIEGTVVEGTEPAAIAAAGTERREIRVNLGGLARRAATPPPAPAPVAPGTPSRMQDLVFAAGDGTGFNPGEGVDWAGVGQIVDRRLTLFNEGQYEAAARKGQHLRQQFSVATFTKPIPADLTITSNDPQHVEDVMARAIDESRLPGGALTASGGWCAPSETLYDLVELESRDGIYDLPEIGLARGGLSHTLGPDFSAIYALAAGFNYTEQDDIDGDYDGAGGGEKPCFRVPCPSFTEDRLGVSGLCIQAGLLQARGYPEMISRVTRGALVAHDHRMAGRRLAAVEAGSTAVVMPAATPGAIAPLLNAIELQVEHYRSVTRISRATSLEAVFPFWVLGAIRNDLARRNGQNALDVTDAQITAWFASRGVRAQYVYNWQDIGGGAGAFTAWPTTVKFLLYAAGTWINATNPVITMDTIYDSVLLGTNDYTALFTEEGWKVLKRSHDSRVVTVAICPDGSTGAQVKFACNGTVAA